MDQETTKKTDGVEKKPYVEPELKRAEKLADIAEGEAPIVSGTVVV